MLYASYMLLKYQWADSPTQYSSMTEWVQVFRFYVTEPRHKQEPREQ